MRQTFHKDGQRVLFYAVGGGLGHLTRIRAVVHTLGIAEHVYALTASPFARNPQLTSDFELIQVPLDLTSDRESFRGWLRVVLDDLRPRAMYVDAFPAGLLGELCDFPFPASLRLYHLARLLRWDEYQPLVTGTPPFYATTYRLEPLTPEHEQFVERNSESVIDLALEDPPFTPSTVERAEARMGALRQDGRPLWLIVHSGPEQEIQRLIAYAQEIDAAEQAGARLVVVAPLRPPGLPSTATHLMVYPAEPLFPYADRIITACSFNLMRQTAPFRDRHHFVPFPRRLDDQFLRAERHGQEPR